MLSRIIWIISGFLSCLIYIGLLMPHQAAGIDQLTPASPLLKR